MNNAEEYGYRLYKQNKFDICSVSKDEKRTLCGYMLEEMSSPEQLDVIQEGLATIAEKSLPFLLTEFMLTDNSKARDNLIEILLEAPSAILENKMDDLLNSYSDDNSDNDIPILRLSCNKKRRIDQ